MVVCLFMSSPDSADNPMWLVRLVWRGFTTPSPTQQARRLNASIRSPLSSSNRSRRLESFSSSLVYLFASFYIILIPYSLSCQSSL